MYNFSLLLLLPFFLFVCLVVLSRHVFSAVLVLKRRVDGWGGGPGEVKVSPGVCTDNKHLAEHLYHRHEHRRWISAGFVGCQESCVAPQTATTFQNRPGCEREGKKRDFYHLSESLLFLSPLSISLSLGSPLTRRKTRKIPTNRETRLIPRHDLNVFIPSTDWCLAHFFPSRSCSRFFSVTITLGGVRSLCDCGSFCLVALHFSISCFWLLVNTQKEREERANPVVIRLTVPAWARRNSGQNKKRNKKRKDDWSLSVAQARSYNSWRAYGTCVITIVINGLKRTPSGRLGPVDSRRKEEYRLAGPVEKHDGNFWQATMTESG